MEVFAEYVKFIRLEIELKQDAVDERANAALRTYRDSLDKQICTLSKQILSECRLSRSLPVLAEEQKIHYFVLVLASLKINCFSLRQTRGFHLIFLKPEGFFEKKTLEHLFFIHYFLWAIQIKSLCLFKCFVSRLQSLCIGIHLACLDASYLSHNPFRKFALKTG